MFKKINSLAITLDKTKATLWDDLRLSFTDIHGQIVDYTKHTDIEGLNLEIWDYILLEYIDSYGSSCNTLNLDWTDEQDVLEEIEYDSDELNCTYCALKEYLIDNCPPGKVICDVDLEGVLLWGGDWLWSGAVNYCSATELPFNQQLLPELTGTGSGATDYLILSSHSIL